MKTFKSVLPYAKIHHWRTYYRWAGSRVNYRVLLDCEHDCRNFYMYTTRSDQPALNRAYRW